MCTGTQAAPSSPRTEQRSQPGLAPSSGSAIPATPSPPPKRLERETSRAISRARVSRANRQVEQPEFSSGQPWRTWRPSRRTTFAAWCCLVRPGAARAGACAHPRPLRPAEGAARARAAARRRRGSAEGCARPPFDSTARSGALRRPAQPLPAPAAPALPSPGSRGARAQSACPSTARRWPTARQSRAPPAPKAPPYPASRRPPPSRG